MTDTSSHCGVLGRRWLWLLVMVMVVGVGGCDRSPTDGPELITRTFLKYESDSGDWIGQGGSAYYTLSSGDWHIDNHGPGHISIRIWGGDFWWSLNLAAPDGQQLKVGTYEGVARWPFHGNQPGLDFGGSGRGCNELTGRFQIHEMERGEDMSLERFHATFRQHCEGGVPALHGAMGVLTNPWR